MLKAVFMMLFGLASFVSLVFLWGMSAGNPNNTPRWLIAGWAIVTGAILFGSWHLKRTGRCGLGCCLLLLGMPAAYVSLLIATIEAGILPVH